LLRSSVTGVTGRREAGYGRERLALAEVLVRIGYVLREHVQVQRSVGNRLGVQGR